MSKQAATFDDIKNELHPDDRVFGVYPNIICQGCGLALKPLDSPLPAMYTHWHPNNDCVYSNRKFRFHALPIIGTLLREEDQ